MSSPDQVNEHYLGHVVSVAETHQVEATEDIVTRNGIKLLAKGARINASVRDRLLQHKLRKPLEDCVRVEGGVTPQQVADTAVEVMQRHPVVATLCGKSATLLVDLLRRQQWTPAMQSLLTVYAEHRPNKLQHAVAVCLVAHGLSHTMRGDVDQQRLLRLAGLLHDVGELYINPALLDRPGQLSPEEWRHLAAHPIVAERLLKGMQGAGPEVAQVVLQHHERLDGFGYPHGMRLEKLSLPGQVLSAAEMLVGLLESGGHPMTRARIAMKLIPGEFSRSLIDIVATAEVGEEAPPAQDLADGIEKAEQRIARIGETLHRFRHSGTVLHQAMAASGPGIREIISHGMLRLQRIQVAFSSTGLDAHAPQQVLSHFESGADAGIHQEVLIVLRELEWRLKELEREALMRTSLLAPNEAPAVQPLLQLLK